MKDALRISKDRKAEKSLEEVLQEVRTTFTLVLCMCTYGHTYAQYICTYNPSVMLMLIPHLLTADRLKYLHEEVPFACSLSLTVTCHVSHPSESVNYVSVMY